MLRNYFFLLLIFLTGTFTSAAQQTFPEKCMGNWEGTLYIYQQGQLRDSVPVQLEVSPTADPVAFTWKTTYQSEDHPMVKDYTMVIDTSAANTYIMKEEENVELFMYSFDNKLYSLFETESTMLSSSYEIRKDTLYFEVNSASTQATGPLVTSFNIGYLQKVRFVRENN